MKAEAIARKELRESLWTVDFKIWSKFGTKDLFNLFDLMAVKCGILKFVQVKTNHGNVSKAKKDILQFANDNQMIDSICGYLDMEIWERTVDKDWIIYSLEYDIDSDCLKWISNSI